MKNVDQYLNHIKDDYTKWSGNLTGNSVQYGNDIIRNRMTQEFCEGVCVKEGSKYIKVCTGNGGTVHSFIVKKDSGKFKAGDILKAASYAAPATNFARGNVLKGDWKNVRWTGA